jgi:S1-C subfamily serine protease
MMTHHRIAAALCLAVWTAGTVAQEPGERSALDQALAAQARRIEVMARCAPAVCSVMSMDAPGGGSGVVFDPAGFVLTNYHVVGKPDLETAPSVPEGAPEADRARGKGHYRDKKVGLPDGELYRAEVLGIDPGSDLAVLRLIPKREGQVFAHCELGDSDSLLVGQPVFAMGNPFLLATDFTPTVTWGIVSGTHRYQAGQGNRMLVYPDCIQVDAPVNPGNSGGPLFDETGKVVGINGRISIGDRGRVNVGVGFAISSKQIGNFLADLMAGRHAEHGTLDMSAWFMNAREAGAAKRGVYVQQMFKDSVAAAAGIGLGDEILAFDGVEVRSANQLATLVGVLPAGAFVGVRYRPSLAGGAFGEPKEVLVKLATLDTGSSASGVGDEARLASGPVRRLAAAALRRHWQTDWKPQLDLTAYRGEDRVLVRRRGELLLVELAFGERRLVLAPGLSEHVQDPNGYRELDAEERERLRRETACNPFLWDVAERSERLRDAELWGGVHVFGAPAYRFRVPGDGDCEAWLRADGTPVGYSFRDPILAAHVAWHRSGERLLRIVDGVAETGWRTTP